MLKDSAIGSVLVRKRICAALPICCSPPARVAVFIDGRYWQGCPGRFTMPGTNLDYWSAKIGQAVCARSGGVNY